jgi:hypothetical protein
MTLVPHASIRVCTCVSQHALFLHLLLPLICCFGATCGAPATSAATCACKSTRHVYCMSGVRRQRCLGCPYEFARDIAQLKTGMRIILYARWRSEREADLTPNTKFALPPPVTTHSHHMTPLRAHANAYMAEVIKERRIKSVCCRSS